MKPDRLIPEGESGGLPLSVDQWLQVKMIVWREVGGEISTLKARLEAESSARAAAEARLRAELLMLTPNLIGKRPPDGFVPLKVAAFAAGFSSSWVRKQIAQGRVRFTKVGGRVFVDPDTLPKRK